MYHGLVTRLHVKKAQALIDMRNNYENKAWFGNFKFQ